MVLSIWHLIIAFVFLVIPVGGGIVWLIYLLRKPAPRVPSTPVDTPPASTDVRAGP
jgi:hypothetical protein